MRSVRDLHDELSDRLAILCNLLDSQAGKSGIEESLRVSGLDAKTASALIK